MTAIVDIQQRLRRFAEVEASGSPLYQHLAAHAAEDDDVMGLLTDAPDGFAAPTLLLAAAHRALQAEPFHDLVNYYPSMGGSYGVDSGTWPLWRSFVVERAAKIRGIIAAHTTQTNEVRRAALLFPAVAIAAKQAKKPIGLLEVGCSAGLLLDLGKYAYRYQTEAGQIVAGPTKTPLGLHCAVSFAPDAAFPTLPKKLAVAARVGLDREPVDLGDEQAAAWLEACIWADQPERQRLFSTAAAFQRKDPPELIKGDAVADLSAAAERVPADAPLVLMTSHVLTYQSPQVRTEFFDAVEAIGRRRPLWWVSNESYEAILERALPGRDDLVPGDGEPVYGVLGFIRWDGGEPVATALARTAPHGERMTWLV
ncbi:MAG: DUF2332 domain-containing protein [Actinomycetota bacterium]|nr:DUF2332 domain-containing protein [Actinomycetota bacterium]